MSDSATHSEGAKTANVRSDGSVEKTTQEEPAYPSGLWKAPNLIPVPPDAENDGYVPRPIYPFSQILSR